jgi:2,3-diketo-5-methylthio-1-phosphopentane phosphatase
MTQREFKVFVDFDGTISSEDVGEAVFNRFGDKQKVEAIINDLLKRKISSRECWISLCDLVYAISADELNDFIDQLEIDKTFHNLVEYCLKKNIELIVLSDGFDYYINRIFNRENLQNLKHYSNHLEIVGGKLIPSFPFLDSEFQTSANCKRNHIISHSSDEDFTVYIGDGNSDKQTIVYCDFIFAKNDLLKYCEKERISYFPFRDFNDVTKKLDEMVSARRLKKRHQAELKRKEAYLIE